MCQEDLKISERERWNQHPENLIFGEEDLSRKFGSVIFRYQERVIKVIQKYGDFWRGEKAVFERLITTLDGKMYDAPPNSTRSEFELLMNSNPRLSFLLFGNFFSPDLIGSPEFRFASLAFNKYKELDADGNMTPKKRLDGTPYIWHSNFQMPFFLRSLNLVDPKIYSHLLFNPILLATAHDLPEEGRRYNHNTQKLEKFPRGYLYQRCIDWNPVWDGLGRQIEAGVDILTEIPYKKIIAKKIIATDKISSLKTQCIPIIKEIYPEFDSLEDNLVFINGMTEDLLSFGGLAQGIKMLSDRLRNTPTKDLSFEDIDEKVNFIRTIIATELSDRLSETILRHEGNPKQALADGVRILDMNNTLYEVVKDWGLEKELEHALLLANRIVRIQCYALGISNEILNKFQMNLAPLRENARKYMEPYISEKVNHIIEKTLNPMVQINDPDKPN